jgi:MFS family permease
VLAFDNPARQSFVSELVGSDKVVNAVALNSVLVHSSRIAGPAIAGGLIALVGVSACFLANAMTFIVMIVALRLMDPALLVRGERAPREPGQLRAAFAYVWGNRTLRVPLLMMVVIGTLSFNFQPLLPLFASQVWHGTSTTYAALTAVMGAGSVLGALAAGARGRVTPALLVVSAAVFGFAELAAGLAPTLPIQLAVLVPLGAASVTFAAGVNSSLQLGAADGMRGRVMALYAVVFLGSTAIGAPFIGWLAQAAGPRSGLYVGAAAALATAVWAAVEYGGDVRAPIRRLARVPQRSSVG